MTFDQLDIFLEVAGSTADIRFSGSVGAISSDIRFSGSVGAISCDI